MSDHEVPIQCKNSPDDFCYVCGEFIKLVELKKRISEQHKRAYLSYFGFTISDQAKHWAPHFICRNCHLGLIRWMNDCDGYSGLKFSKPMCWREPNNHHTDCYFCATRVDADTGAVEYANVISATKPTANQTVTHTQKFVAHPPIAPRKPEESLLILPNELDLLISGLNLSERTAEIMVKALQEWKILAPCKYSMKMFQTKANQIFHDADFLLYFSSNISSAQSGSDDMKT